MHPPIEEKIHHLLQRRSERKLFLPTHIFLSPLHLLAEKLQKRLISPLILGLDALILQVRSRSHPAVDLIPKSLNVVGNLERLFKLLDSRLVLLLGCQQRKGDSEALGVGWVDHGGMGYGTGGEGVGGSLEGEGNDFAAPAVLFEIVCQKFLFA